jgi:hypothetical protein
VIDMVSPPASTCHSPGRRTALHSGKRHRHRTADGPFEMMLPN